MFEGELAWRKNGGLREAGAGVRSTGTRLWGGGEDARQNLKSPSRNGTPEVTRADLRGVNEGS